MGRGGKRTVNTLEEFANWSFTRSNTCKCTKFAKFKCFLKLHDHLEVCEESCNKIEEEVCKSALNHQGCLRVKSTHLTSAWDKDRIDNGLIVPARDKHTLTRGGSLGWARIKRGHYEFTRVGPCPDESVEITKDFHDLEKM